MIKSFGIGIWIIFAVLYFSNESRAEEVCGLTIGSTNIYKIIEPSKHPLYSDSGIRQRLDTAKFALLANDNPNLVLGLVMEDSGSFPTDKKGILSFYEFAKGDIARKSPGVNISGGVRFEESTRIELTIQRQISNDSTHVDLTTWYFQKPDCNIGLEVQAVYGSEKLSSGTPEITAFSHAFQNDIQTRNKGKMFIPHDSISWGTYLGWGLFVIFLLLIRKYRKSTSAQKANN